jgi:hypothetical protein
LERQAKARHGSEGLVGYLILVLLAVGVVIAYPGEPLAWGFAALIALGLVAFVYNKTREIKAREAMIELNERDKQRGG